MSRKTETDRAIIFETRLHDDERSPNATVHALNTLLTRRRKTAPAAFPA